MMIDKVPTEADKAVRECLAAGCSFALIAGAGSGKTTSLIAALDEVRSEKGKALRQNGQRVACITYTKRATEIIKSRLGFDELYEVSTLHSFLWGEIARFQRDIGEALEIYRIPNLLAKAQEKDTGRNTKESRKARIQVETLQTALEHLRDVAHFQYDDVVFSDYLNGRLSHDDVIEISGYLLKERPKLPRLLGFRYPYIFVDEAQDTFETIVEGLNSTCADEGLPLIGYFGDPWQQIYDGRAGNFAPPSAGQVITKAENFRCSPEVIALLNAFRDDVKQVPGGANKDVKGSVEIRLVRAEDPEGERRRYSEPQLERALGTMDQAIADWGWNERDDVIRLFLVRQMIARRLGFSNLNQLFTGKFASRRAQDDYESGEHYLLRPFIKTIRPLISAFEAGQNREVIDILRSHSPAFRTDGANANRKLKEMIDKSKQHLQELSKIWDSGTVKETLVYCCDQELIVTSDRLREELQRDPRSEEYDEEVYGEEKGEWLADELFSMPTAELETYCDFILDNTAYSTQHGVKGEEYPNVLVVFDDVEARWNDYNFIKLFAPRTFGDPTEGQSERGKRLAYVCFSRAEVNLRILLFTTDPEAVQNELIERGFFSEEQIVVHQV